VNEIDVTFVKRGEMNYATADDAELVAAAREGDIDAFEGLVRRHSGAVYAHATRFFGDASAADDVAQEVFIKVYRSLDTFGERSRFSTWLYRITRNTCLDQVRGGKRRPIPVDPLDVSASAPGDLSDQVALAASVEAAMRSLAPEDRDALSAVSVFGLSYAEAADALGVPEGTVKSRVFRARRSLSATLGLTKGGA
jgi:RNA polymerase sigma-70 factor (ECF subfamily)